MSGEPPRVPSEALAQELRARAAEACAEAAARVREADVLLLCTGAGFSADSGLPTYADIADVPAYAAQGLGYPDLCNPKMLREHPDLFWGFWGNCFNRYRRTTPHEGYSIIEAWAERHFRHSRVAKEIEKEMAFLEPTGYDWRPSEFEPYHVPEHAGAFFVNTSNVDAHHHDWFRACEIRECHGNIELYQCAKAKAAACPGVWRAPAEDFAFSVDPATLRAAPGPPLGAAPAPAGSCASGHERLTKLRHMPRPACSQAAEGAFGCNHPVCRFCGGPARPAVLMFEDEDWQDNVPQLQRKQRWLHAVLNLCGMWEGGLRVAILEIGCGGNVTTVRNSSEQILRGCLSGGADAHLIRINMELPLGDEDDFAPRGKFQNRVISIMGRGLESLRRIDAELAQAAAGPAAAADAVAGAAVGEVLAAAAAAAGAAVASATAAAACGGGLRGDEGLDGQAVCA